jgi:Transcriptional regulator PadR-like family
MSVPLTLLGLLERGPSHGYDLKRDYDAYFGRGRPLRYSQAYATLSRLARDGKAVAGPVEQGAGPELKRDSDPIGVLLADHALYRLEADLRWMDHTAARLDLLARAVRR